MFYLYRGLNSVNLLCFIFLLPSVCKQQVVNGLQELGSSFHKQTIRENSMDIQEDKAKSSAKLCRPFSNAVTQES